MKIQLNKKMINVKFHKNNNMNYNYLILVHQDKIKIARGTTCYMSPEMLKLFVNVKDIINFNS